MSLSSSFLRAARGLAPARITEDDADDIFVARDARPTRPEVINFLKFFASWVGESYGEATINQNTSVEEIQDFLSDMWDSQEHFDKVRKCRNYHLLGGEVFAKAATLGGLFPPPLLPKDESFQVTGAEAIASAKGRGGAL